MAIKSIKDLPSKKRPTAKQIESAKKLKPKAAKHRVVGKTGNRIEISLGKHSKKDAPSVVKYARQKFKKDVGAIIKDKDGNVIARTHYAKGSSTIPEQLVVKALSKYAKGMDEVIILLSYTKKGRKRK